MRFSFTRVAIAASAVAALAACNGNGGNGTTPPPQANPFVQVDRLNRPAVNEVFAPFARHDTNNRDMPNDDQGQLKNDIYTFMTGTAGRSPAISTFVASVLVPDVQIADLSGTSQSCIGTAPGTCNNYLGVETAGATQAPAGLKPFGGRALTDDIVDISLSVIFGSTVPALSGGAIPDDNAELDGRADPTWPNGHRPNLTSDGVSYQTAPKHFTATFPYLGNPQ